ncbi:MAG: shikimate dehydrogenase, partial [Bacteroidota bacterium]
MIHNAAFASQGLPFCYVALAVEPEHIGAAVAGLRALGFAGSNVTVPHKEAVIPHLDVLSEAAAAIGAVNTIVCRPDGSMYGDNTDAAGFLAPLLPREHDLMGSEMVIFGAGGAARAAVYGLLTTFKPSRLTLAVRTPARAEALARDLAPHDAASALDVVPITEAGPAVASSRLLVNATSVGMTPHDAQSVWTTFEAHHLAYDLVYTPRHTRFLQLAEAAG